MNYLDLAKLSDVRAELPEALAAHPSMMSLPEREVLYGLARDAYRGDGVIVDAGVFMGASTRLFGKGIEANPRRDAIVSRYKRPIQTYEYGRFNRTMLPFFERHGIEHEAILASGSFVSELFERIADIAYLANVRIGDIVEQQRDERPIEILFLDVVKSPAINRFCLENFFPLMIPGRTILIQQDYYIDRLPFLKISQEHLADYFEYLGAAHSSAYFRLLRPIPAEALEAAGQPDAMSLDRRLALIGQCARRVEADLDRDYLVRMSEAIVLAEVEGTAAAEARLAALAKTYPAQVTTDHQFAKRMATAREAVHRDIAVAARREARRAGALA